VNQATPTIAESPTLSLTIRTPTSAGSSAFQKYASGSPRSSAANLQRSSSSRKVVNDDGASDSDTDGVLFRHERALNHPEELQDITSSSMIYLSLGATPITMLRLFRPYLGYINYWSQKKTFFHLFQGMVNCIFLNN